MKRPFTLLYLLALVLFQFSCGKDNLPSVRTHEELPSSDDRSSIRLKEVEETGSPSPLFRFSYNDSGYVTHIDYASGFFQYEVNYLQKKVAGLVNTPDNALLTYRYDNGRVSSILKTDDRGIKRWNYVFGYEGGRLVSVKWFRFEQGSDSVLEREAKLTYGTDGNLSIWKDYWRTGNPELSLNRTFSFKNYDSNTNVDDFYLLKTFFEDVLFLPGVKLQKNNPGLVEIKGVQNDYEIRYSYTIQNRLPISKKGIFRQTRGSGSGTEIEQLTRFSYE